MFVAKARDLRFTPTGMLRQKRIASPKMRYFMPRARRCAAKERPYGPAPIIATSISGFIPKIILSARDCATMSSSPVAESSFRALCFNGLPRPQGVQCRGEWVTGGHDHAVCLHDVGDAPTPRGISGDLFTANGRSDNTVCREAVLKWLQAEARALFKNRIAVFAEQLKVKPPAP